jgi:sugar/nucleoside kinase (ribokinase family)
MPLPERSLIGQGFYATMTHAMAHTNAGSIVVCGHLCLDFIPGFPSERAGQDWFRPGRLSVVNAPSISTGGAVSNVGLALHRLGLPVRLVAKVGNDPLGSLIVEKLRGGGAQLARDLITIEGEVTSYTVVLNPPGIDRIFFHCPGANDTFTDSDVADAVLSGATLFHFGYPPLMRQIWSDGGERLERLLVRARGHGAMTSLDMSLPDPSSPSGMIDWKAFLSRVLPKVDIFVPSIEELLFMMDRQGFKRLSEPGGGESIIRQIRFDDLARLAEPALSRGVRAILIKLGSRGAYLRTGPEGLPGMSGWADRELYSPVFKVPRVVGTAGAGDSTIAGFLASIFRGLDPEAALAMAVAVGGCCVEEPDATSGIRTWEETRARVQEGWARAAVTVDEPGWNETPSAIWRGPKDGR